MISRNKKPSQVLAHLAGREDAHLREASSPNNFNIVAPTCQVPGRVWPLLGIGAANAVSRSALASVLRTSERDVRRLVNRERRAGLPICSAVESAGYFRPASPDDIARFEKSMRSRARETVAVADAARRALDAMMGQTRIAEVWDDG